MRGSTAGLAEGTIAQSESVHATFLDILDILFSSLIVGPAVIGYWRGTWNLMGYVLAPSDQYMSAVLSVIIGTVGHFVLTLYQDKLSVAFHPDKHRIAFFVFSRIYTAAYGIICVNGWRGGWLLMDQLLPYKIPILLAITLTSAFLLALFKGLRNISAAPFAISTDRSKDYFVIPTMYKTSVCIRLLLQKPCPYTINRRKASDLIVDNALLPTSVPLKISFFSSLNTLL